MLSGKLKKGVAQALELPDDVVLNLPKIIMNGDREISCGGYGGLLEYTEECIKLAAGGGKLQIEGENFAIKNIDPDEIIISGLIKSVRFI